MILSEKLELGKKWIIITLTILYLLIVFISAWLSDDAYITFRTVDNFINGYGLTWNIGERVQIYTHPLWMFLLSGFYFFTKEIYFTSITVSIIISGFSVFLLLYKLSVSLLNTLVVGLILILSKAFIDYSTSGLENPLSYLLLVLFFIIYFKNEEGNKKLFILSIIASLAVLNRMDIILIYLPALIAAYLRGDKKKGLLIVAVGFLPFILWEMFSLFYYGFPFPNTAYAKLNIGIDQIEFVRQGLNYMLNSLYIDPLTLIVIMTSLFIVIIKKNKNLLPVAIGIILYLFYIMKIGGDFMSGRFFTVPLLCSAIIIAKLNYKTFKMFSIQVIILLILGFISPRPTLLSNQNYHLLPKIYKAYGFGPMIYGWDNDITDERYYYYQYTGLLNNVDQQKILQHPWSKAGILLNKSYDSVVVKPNVGFVGYYSGAKIFIIDPLALTDPLLSHLPAAGYWPKIKDNKIIKTKWRIGHFYREIPAGYLETITSGENKIEDRSLKKYYDRLSFVIKGDLFDFNRIAEIWNLNLGKYDYLIDDFEKKLLNDR